MIPPKDHFAALAKAFDRLNYDVGLLSKEEALAFDQTGVVVDASRKTYGQAPFTTVKTDDGDVVGFLRFPPLPTEIDSPSPELVKKISTFVKEKRKEVTLVVALSDWGFVAERSYLDQQPEAVPDFLFGSGHGSGVNGRILADGRCVWVRPYDKGRTVNEVQVLTWPDRSKPIAWKDGINFNCISIGLGDQYEDNDEIDAILH